MLGSLLLPYAEASFSKISISNEPGTLSSICLIPFLFQHRTQARTKITYVGLPKTPTYAINNFYIVQICQVLSIVKPKSIVNTALKGDTGFPHHPKVEHSYESFYKVYRNGESKEAITLGHILLTNAQIEIKHRCSRAQFKAMVAWCWDAERSPRGRSSAGQLSLLWVLTASVVAHTKLYYHFLPFFVKVKNLFRFL